MSPRAKVGDRVWRLPDTVILLTAFPEESACKGPGRGRRKEGVWGRRGRASKSTGVTLSKSGLSEMIGALSESRKP